MLEKTDARIAAFREWLHISNSHGHAFDMCNIMGSDILRALYGDAAHDEEETFYHEFWADNRWIIDETTALRGTSAQMIAEAKAGIQGWIASVEAGKLAPMLPDAPSVDWLAKRYAAGIRAVYRAMWTAWIAEQSFSAFRRLERWH